MFTRSDQADIKEFLITSQTWSTTPGWGYFTRYEIGVTFWHAKTQKSQFQMFQSLWWNLTRVHKDIFSYVMVTLNVFVMHRKKKLKRTLKHHLQVSSVNLFNLPIGPIKTSQVVYREMMVWLWKTVPLIKTINIVPIKSHINIMCTGLWNVARYLSMWKSFWFP